jgi:hypothetical protein
MEEISGFKIAWRMADGENLSKMCLEYHKTYDYLKYLVLQHISIEQFYDIVYFQRYKPRKRKLTFMEYWRQYHPPQKPHKK